jgi:hypothetical protein
MDSVEQATTSLPSSMPDENGDNGDGQAPAASAATDVAASTLRAALLVNGSAARTDVSRRQPAGVQSLGDLLTAGAAFLQELGQSLRQADSANPTRATGAMSRLIDRDTTTGQTYLKLPLPQGDAMQSLASLFQTVVNSLQQKPRP